MFYFTSYERLKLRHIEWYNVRRLNISRTSHLRHSHVIRPSLWRVLNIGFLPVCPMHNTLRKDWILTPHHSPAEVGYL